MNFANPEYLLLIGLLIPYLWLWWKRRNKQPAVQVSNFGGLSQVRVWSGWKYLPVMQMLLFFGVWVLVVIALARPQSELQEESIKRNGIDIVLALDVSGSMMAEDLKPNRMQAAKESIKKFIDGRDDDRMGVIVFAGKAFTQSPLTFDYAVLKEYLEQTSTETVNQRVSGLSGTAIGDAILAGVNRFDTEDVDRSRVLILATDGDANLGVDPVLAAQKAADEGVKLYTIGIGSEEGALIPTTNVFGQQVWMTDESGQPAKAVFNEESLQELAEIGGGKYFRADDNARFDEVLAEINELEKSEVVVATTTRYVDDHQSWLIAAFVGLVILIFLLVVKPVVR